uniref:TIGR03643 family protein n=1 Tax=Flavobacterium sp. TaxID=239 RepID=UPI00404B5A83
MLIIENLNEIQIDRIIEMAWEDRTPFEAIEFQFGLKEMDVKALMRNQLKRKSYELWRKRVTNRRTKHEKLRTFTEGRFKCTLQRQITNNKISKR